MGQWRCGAVAKSNNGTSALPLDEPVELKQNKSPNEADGIALGDGGAQPPHGQLTSESQTRYTALRHQHSFHSPGARLGNRCRPEFLNVCANAFEPSRVP